MSEALSHARAGRFRAADQTLGLLLARDPRHVGAMILRASVQLELGNPESALATVGRALTLDPGNARAHAAQGDALQVLDRSGEAVHSYDRAVALKSDYVAAWANRGNALTQLGQFEAALASYDQALAVAPDLPAVHSNRSRALDALERGDEALASADRAVALNPGYSNGWMVRGAALYRLGRYQEALESYQAAERIIPGAYDVLASLGMAYTALGSYAQALAVLDAAIAADPQQPLARYRRAHVRLLLCDFREGWRDYEARWGADLFVSRSAGYVSPAFRRRLTLNARQQDLAGRRVLLVSEQGVGDQIMFASMIPDVLRQAASVTLLCDPRLVSLLSRSFPGARIVGPEQAADPAVNDVDVVLATGSLGGVYRNSLTDFPKAPYLSPDPQVVEAWRSRLGPRQRALRVGVSWRGGTRTTGVSARSIPLSDLQPLLDRQDCEFVSLQYGDPRNEVESLRQAGGPDIRLFPPDEIDDFGQLAGLISALDLVISVQTTVVHLAGALGQRCLVLVPKKPEWRYTADAATLPWYGSVQVFRQASDEDWGPAVARVTRSVGDIRAR